MPHCVKSIQIRTFFWSVFPRIRTEYGEVRSVSPYSVRMRENTDKKKLCIWTLFRQCQGLLLELVPVFDELVYRVVSSKIIIKVCRNFKEDLHINSVKQMSENQYYFENHLFQTLIDIHRFLLGLIECLQPNQNFCQQFY